MPQDGAVILSFVTPDKRDPDYRRFFSHVTVEYKEADGAAVVYQGPVNPADTLIDGLKNGVYYTFTVKVVDKNGVISDGVSVGATPVDTTVPSGVSELTLKRGLKSVTLMWLTPTKQGITAVRIHTVRLSDFYPTGTQTVAVREGYYSEFRITGLENDVTYRFFVSAIDGYGNVSSPVCIDGTPDGDAPGEPEEVEISALSGEGYENGGAVRIRWFIPRIGGTEIDDYDYTEIVYGRRGYVPDIKVDQEVRGETVDGFYRETVEVTGLQNGIEYAFRLTVYDTAGNSSSGLFVYAVPFSSFKPEALSAEPLVTRFEEQALISWKTPDSAAGVDLYHSSSEFTADSINEPSVVRIENPLDLGTYLDYPRTERFWFLIVVNDHSSPYNGLYEYWPEDKKAFEVVPQESAGGTESLPPVRNAKVAAGNQSVVLTWTNSVSASDGVRVGFLYGTDSDDVKNRYENFTGDTFGRFDLDVATEAGGEQSQTVSGLSNRVRTTFAVFLYDAAGRKSPPVYLQAMPMPTAGPFSPDLELPSGRKLPMSMIPAGTWFSGAEGVTAVREVVLTEDFLIYRSETEYELWRIVYDWAVSGGGYRFYSPGKEGGSSVFGGSPTPDAELPVVDISWYDAVVWCNALTEYYNTKNPPEPLIPVYLVAGSTETEDVEEASLRALRDISQMSSSEARDRYDRVVFNRKGTGFRLPTEAEWEYAAGYIDGSIRLSGASYSCGWDYIDDHYRFNESGEWVYSPQYTLEDRQTVHRYVWYGLTQMAPDAYNSFNVYIDNNSGNRVHGNSELYSDNDGDRTTPVGLINMSGNVYEWVWDWYRFFPSYDGQIEYVIDPVGPEAPASFRVRRGGSAFDDLQYSRIAFRNSDVPTEHREDGGFRFVCTVK